MFALNTESLVWNELFATSKTSGPMKKAYCGLLAFDEWLLAFGGQSEEDPSNPSPSAKYEKDDTCVYTNEHHLFDLKSGEHRF